MKVTSTLSFLFCSLLANHLPSQTPQDLTIPVSATVDLNPASVTLDWPNPAASNVLVLRRTKGQGGIQWIQLLSATNSTQTSFTDNTVTAGQTYEYVIQRTTTVNAYGYAMVAVHAPVTDNRGKLLLFVDADIAGPLSGELERLRNDLAGDGWQIVEHAVDSSATVQIIKNQIVADYNADPSHVKSVFLLGKIPVPYSGNTNWDGHPEHQGAWPADAYYADVNGTWTDATVNNTSPARDANDNIPGDGKFDQSVIPSAVELQVGRVDLRRLSAATFGATTAELLKRYLDKNHNWRTGGYAVDSKALVDDNFGYFNGEAFAENGYRNAYALVGNSNVVAGDFIDDAKQHSYLLGYGCGGGWYSGAGGVGASGDFAVDTVNIVFANLFGSYHGDWDYETDPFMPAALASRGGILTCSWAGRPHHFYQALASGETIGYCMKETQNAQYNNGYFGSFGESGAHVALLGDPTLRALVVKPPHNATATAGCGKVSMEWAASPDTAVTGYYVYRSLQKYGSYARITASPVAGTSFVDDSPVADTLYYQVRALKQQISPGGGVFTNSSTGVLASVSYDTPVVPEVTIENTGILTCTQTAVSLLAVSNPAGTAYAWQGPGNFSSSLQNISVSQAGVYNLTVTFANGCTTQSSVSVQQAPPLQVEFQPSLPACDGMFPLGVKVEGGTPPYQYLWTNGDTLPATIYHSGDGLDVGITVTDAGGCMYASPVITIAWPDPTLVAYTVTDESAPGHNDGGIVLNVTGGTPPFTYLWSNGASGPVLENIPGGTYTVTITEASGCTRTATVEVKTTSGAVESALPEQISLAPNPSAGTVILGMALKRPAWLRIEVRDATGKKVWERAPGVVSHTRISLDLGGSPPGIYAVSIWIDNEVVVRKLALAR